jgi:hypothetical protein
VKLFAIAYIDSCVSTSAGLLVERGPVKRETLRYCIQ